jgi:hypothetical protein
VILSYELQIGDESNGEFVSIVGYDSNSLLTTFLVTKSIVKGSYHQFRYRAKNTIGWGPYSGESSILAATVPSAPLKPLFQSFSASVVNI